MKSQLYNIFWQRIHNSAKDHGFPLRVMFELTYRCNFKCRHCYVPFDYRKKGELKTKEVFSILDRLAEAGCFYLGFTGGELFMRRDIFDILWYARKKGFEIIIYSNGSLIDNKKADALAQLRPNKVDITIPAMSKTVFDKVTGTAGYRDKVFKAIELLRERRVDLGFKTCVLKENASGIKEIQDFAASLGAQHRLDDTLSRRLDGSEEPFRYRGQMADDRRQVTGKEVINDFCISNRNNGSLRAPAGRSNPAFEIASSSFDKLRTLRNDVNLFRCGVGQSQAAITPLGELKPCLMIDYPRFKILNREQRTDLKTAWDRLKELVSSIKPDENYKCNKCELEIYCKWCPARSWLAYGSFTGCEAESYRRAEAIKQSLNC